MGAFQSLVAYAVYWLWAAPTSEYPRDLRHHIQHDDWCYILCAFYRLFHQCYSVNGFSWPQL